LNTIPIQKDGLHIRTILPVDASATIGDANQEAFERASRALMGKQLQGSVTSRLVDDSFLVKIAGLAVRMPLPPNVQVGDTLDLTLVATSPRPTFQLGTGHDEATTSLSSASKLIGSLLQAGSQDQAPTAISSKIPIIASPPLDPAHVATALQQTLTFSGLFYEAHIAEWADGVRSLPDLMQEPQAKAAEQLLQASQTGEDTSKLSDAINTALAQLLNQQLDTLEFQRIAWRGNVWPGQSMEWEIREDAGEQPDKDAAGPQEKSWQSTVRFELPMLGTVMATIQLTGDQLQIQVNARKASTATSLKTCGQALATALDAAGTPLASLSVKQNEEA
jgi:hypothetical protein